MSKGSSREPTAPPPAQAARQSSKPDPGFFDEESYLRLNPDVRKAVTDGRFASGRDHFELFGRGEGRPTTLPSLLVRDRVVFTEEIDRTSIKPKNPVGFIEKVTLSSTGGVYVVGWVNDKQDQIESIDLYFPSCCVALSTTNLARVRRSDVEAALSLATPHNCGFWGFTYAARPLPVNVCNAVLRLKSGAELRFLINVVSVSDEELRKNILSGLAEASFCDNPYFAAVQSIDAAIGMQLIAFNGMITRRAINAPHVERFGRPYANYKATIIVCLFGKIEFMYVQQATYSRQPGIGDYEFIYVCNSPDTAEPLLREVQMASLIYGLDITVILLNANAGFAAANNLAAKYARSARLLFVNPDVFPRDADWAMRHSAIVDNLPEIQTSLFGAPLYYDDGSLMHGGMYFEVDTMHSFSYGRHQETAVLRVEHYGKGAAPDTVEFLESRPVPAVSGAFISVRRDWFEALGGFSEDYIFGHYEDADLCLRSLDAGYPSWMHDAKLWHLEGKGSHRQPQHDGGAVVNRWLFTKTWKEIVEDRVMGQVPRILAGELKNGM